MAEAGRIVALGAIGFISNQTTNRIARRRILTRSIVWQSHCLKLLRARPARPYPLDDHIDLLVGKNAPLLLNKGRHSCVGHPLRDHLPQSLITHESKIKRIVEWARHPKAAIYAVTTGAVLGIELVEGHDLSGTFPARRFVWFSR